MSARTKKPVGRPTKYTRERAQVIYDAIARGYYAEEAAALAGISKATYYNWIEEHPEFLDTISQKTAESQGPALRTILTAINEGSADAAFKFLARRFPQQWGEKTATKTEVSGTINHDVHFIDAYAGIADLATRSTGDS